MIVQGLSYRVRERDLAIVDKGYMPDAPTLYPGQFFVVWSKGDVAIPSDFGQRSYPAFRLPVRGTWNA